LRCLCVEDAGRVRWQGEFIPAVSSIKILDKEQAPGFDVFLAEKSDGEKMGCDGCKNHSVPLCVEYCTKTEDLRKILGEFFEKIERR
jgi:hypothetical protein